MSLAARRRFGRLAFGVRIVLGDGIAPRVPMHSACRLLRDRRNSGIVGPLFVDQIQGMGNTWGDAPSVAPFQTYLTQGQGTVSVGCFFAIGCLQTGQFLPHILNQPFLQLTHAATQPGTSS